MTKDIFLKGVSNWNNHLHLLWPSLRNMTSRRIDKSKTIGLDVVEFGMGDGSTWQLDEYCIQYGHKLFSFDNNLEWVNKFKHLEKDSMENGIVRHSVQFVEDWDSVMRMQLNIGVLLIDHAPGERRKIDIGLYFNKARIIVCHDTEPAADHGYQMRDELAKFKYMIDFKSEGAWASAVSNSVDVTKFEA